MDIIEKLTELFKEFPGIGERQARRFVYFLMGRNQEYASLLVKLITDLKKSIIQCQECFRFFVNDHNKNLCFNCSSQNVDDNLILIVEKDGDLESIEKSRAYNGKYFVLGGLVPIIEKNTPKQVRITELKRLVASKPNLKEIILAFSLSPQGDHTDFYIRQEISELTKKNKIKISSLGRGLSTGTELEYSDNETLKNALKNRH